MTKSHPHQHQGHFSGEQTPSVRGIFGLCDFHDAKLQERIPPVNVFQIITVGDLPPLKVTSAPLFLNIFHFEM